MKQSSIEWLEQRIKEMFLPLSQEETLLKYIQQAKEMHKQEIIESYVEGADTGEMFNNENRVFTTDAKQYYNKTFKSE